MAGCGEAVAQVHTYGRHMERRTAGNPPILQAAARARIDEMSAGHGDDAAAEARAMWALGDYHRFAKQTVWGLGPVLVEACAVSAGVRVLDVAAGSGNVAIRAAEAGAEVVASDLTPENLDAGRREARARGVDLDWVEANAEALPFRDGEFDVVTSAVGAIFASDQQAVADELVRVCRPGGTIGMINFTPDGLAAEFFGILGRHAPPPPEAPSPLLWGDPDHVRDLFGERLRPPETTRRQYVEHSPGDPDAYCDFFKETFGPIIGLYASLAGEPDRLEALDREFRELAASANAAPPGKPAEYRYEYLLVVGKRA
jgi:ubiquinone/menaquinone biosynthesis C-methylase UbiE